MRHDRIGMAMTHAMLGLEPSHHLHVLHSSARLEQVKPMRYGQPVLLFDGREILSGSFGFIERGHFCFSFFMWTHSPFSNKSSHM